MYNTLNFKTDINVTDFTLIIPSVSVGNVPQLTADLIISMYKLQKVATIWDLAIIPAVGSDPFDAKSNDLCTACELYCNEDLKLAVVQLRSGIEPEFAKSFYEKLHIDVAKLQFKNVILLGSLFDHEMHNIQASKFRYLSTDLADDVFKINNILKIELNEMDDYSLPGIGYISTLYKELKHDIKCTLLAKYVSEGDNRPDAIAMLQILNNIITNFNTAMMPKIKFPPSWNHVFGNPPPIGLLN